MTFSQRQGYKALTKQIQKKDIDLDLMNSLWNALTTCYWEKIQYGGNHGYLKDSSLETLLKKIWMHHFKKPIDEMSYRLSDNLHVMKLYFYKCNWHDVYDFIEFVAQSSDTGKRAEFTKACNQILEREFSAYRFVNDSILEIASSQEISEIELAIANSTPFYGVKQHIEQAIVLMSDKKSPDYRNSIKESISAVESLCKTLSSIENATLGEALKFLEKKGNLHPALKAAFNSLYGYTSDADGIRHALMVESNLTNADARFMLISCSAFINYVIDSTK